MTTLTLAALMLLTASPAARPSAVHSRVNYPELRLSAPRILENRLEIDIEGPPRRLRNAEIHAEGNRVVIFIVGVRATPRVIPLRGSPVATLRVGTARRGTPIVLRLRGAARAKDRVTLVRGRPWTLRVRGRRRPPLQQRRAAPRGDATAVAPQASTPKLTTSAAPSIETPTSADKRAQRLASVLPPVIHKTTWLGGILLLICLAAVIWLRRRQKRGAGGSDNSIDVVALQNLSGKHALALVETCGERLLLSTTDKDVRLLSHLGDRTAGFSESLDREQRANTAMPDVQGLFRLRTGNSPNSSNSSYDGAAA